MEYKGVHSIVDRNQLLDLRFGNKSAHRVVVHALAALLLDAVHPMQGGRVCDLAIQGITAALDKRLNGRFFVSHHSFAPRDSQDSNFES
jgi:hypothetical protein